MNRLELEHVVWNYLFDISTDEEKLYDEIEDLLHHIDSWCGYEKSDIDDYWNNETKRYEFHEDLIPFVIDHFLLAKKLKYSDWIHRFIKITPTVRRQLSVWGEKLNQRRLKDYGRSYNDSSRGLQSLAR